MNGDLSRRDAETRRKALLHGILLISPSLLAFSFASLHLVTSSWWFYSKVQYLMAVGAFCTGAYLLVAMITAFKREWRTRLGGLLFYSSIHSLLLLFGTAFLLPNY